MKQSRSLALGPVVSILLAVFSVQGGATIAKGLFPVIGAAGTAAVRIGLSAIILLAVFRPPVHRFTAAQWRAVVPYGVSIGVMNLLFYQALVRIPLGLAVTLEFVGPLGVAIVASRRALDARLGRARGDRDCAHRAVAGRERHRPGRRRDRAA